MKRLRVILATVFAISTIAIAVPTPAYACPPDEGMPCECADDLNDVWYKLFHEPLVYCPY